MAELREEGRPTIFSIEKADGGATDVFVNPDGAEVLGDQNPDTACQVTQSACTVT